MLSFLDLLIVARKIGIREFERRTKMSAGTLARLFSGKITLKFQTVLDMLAVLDVPPAAFFAVVFSADEAHPERAEDLLRRVQSLSFPAAPPAAIVFTKREIRLIIEEILAERQPSAGSPDGDEPSPSNEPKPSRRVPRPRRPRKPKT